LNNILILKKAIHLFSIGVIPLFSQNLQLHYELSDQRQYLVSTLEGYTQDTYGATYWFVDFEYNESKIKSASSAYLEFARYINLPTIDLFQTTIQYNDGLTSSFSFDQIWLGGISREMDIPFIPFTLDILYRKQTGHPSNDIQLTVVWFKPMYSEKLLFAGFVDLWSFDNASANGKDWILFSEPQVWYTFWQNAAIGGEVHIQYNFPTITSSFEFYPTIGFKWDF